MPPKTAREALIAELLGDIDEIVKRVENVDSKLTITTETITKATDGYKKAVALYNEQAKADLMKFLDLKTVEVSKRLEESQQNKDNPADKKVNVEIVKELKHIKKLFHAVAAMLTVLIFIFGYLLILNIGK